MSGRTNKVTSRGRKKNRPRKTFIGTADALAAALREPVERRTIYRWLKLSGCPGRRENGKYCVEEWQAWVDAMGLKGGETTIGQEIKEKRAALGYEREQFELARDKGYYILGEEVAAGDRQIAEKVKADLVVLPTQLAAQFPSIAAEIEKTAGETIREILKKWSEHYGQAAE